MLALDTYIRISREGYRSDEEVRAQIDRYVADCSRVAATEGGETVSETDVSGTLAADDRLLGRLIVKVENGESGGIVSPDVERFARDIIHGLQAWDRIVAAGGRLVFPLDGIDSADGDPDIARERFTHALLRGEGYAKRQGGKLQRIASESVEAGIHSGSIAPLGYQWPGTTVTLPNGKSRFKKSGPLEPTADKARVLAGFKCFDGGGSWRDVTRAFGVAGQGAARNILRNRVYLGIAYGAGTERADSHPAIVPADLFARVQRKLADRVQRNGDGTVKPKGRTGRATLSKVLRCGSCGSSLSLEARTGSYRCKDMHCTSRVSVNARAAEDYVLEAAREHHANTHAAVAMALAVEDAMLPALEAAVIEAQANVLEVETAEGLSPARRAQAATEADKALEEARRALDNAEASQGWHSLAPKRVAAKLKGADAETLNSFVREMLTATVAPAGRAKRMPVGERVQVQTLVAGKLATDRDVLLKLAEVSDEAVVLGRGD